MDGVISGGFPLTSCALPPELQRLCTVKNIRRPMLADIFVVSFPYFNGTGSVYTFVSVNRRNNEARAHVHGKLATKYPFVDIRIFLQCARAGGQCLWCSFLPYRFWRSSLAVFVQS